MELLFSTERNPVAWVVTVMVRILLFFLLNLWVDLTRIGPRWRYCVDQDQGAIGRIMGRVPAGAGACDHEAMAAPARGPRNETACGYAGRFRTAS
ncbi:hypothetical protein DKG74_09755 [Zavarzinia aquatilis]|uniref:Uncharacterized protein n=1 Tax=Zavarzinia aquatilis TaxID=2211142 RepID=A0A317ECP2_9PROT|nr:hypothetical protein DKG74_09755 [Zavarzinia aquatilis]